MRKDQFTYRQKNYALLGIFVLMLIVCYKRSFVLTIAAQNEIELQETQLQTAENAQSEIEILQMQIVQLNNNIGKTDLEPDKVQQRIMGEISELSEEVNTRVESLQRTHVFQTVDYNIYSNQIAVEGGFQGILEVAYQMENGFDYARLTNVAIYKEKDHSQKKTILYGSFLFQHFKQL